MEFDFLMLPVLGALGLFYLWLKRKRERFSPSILKHSLGDQFLRVPSSLRARLSFLPRWLWLFGGLFLALAFLDPHRFIPRDVKEGMRPGDPKEGRILLFAVDRSGSMREKATRAETKLDLMKSEVASLISKRENDLIGLIAFARTASILAPPTLDHKAVLDALRKITVVPSPELDGTAIGYAILKGATLIAGLKEEAEALGKEAPYNIEGAAIVLVTDGLQDPNPLDRMNRFRSVEVEQAARYAKDKGVRLYIVNIEPKLATAKYVPNMREMRRIAELTGGAFYFAGSDAGLNAFLEKISELETAPIRMGGASDKFPALFKRESYFKELILIGSLLLFLGFFLRNTWLREETG